MIEFRIFPLNFVVALLALAAIFCFVYIVATMTVDTRGAELDFKLALLVTAIARRIGVAATQCKMRVAVVIEINRLPRFFVVAAFAFIAVLAAMHIVNGMTGHTSLRCIFEAL